MTRKELMLMDPVNDLMMADDDDFLTTFPTIGRTAKLAGVTTADKGRAFEIAVKTPGFEKKDLKVNIKNGMVTVEGVRKEERKVKTAGGSNETRSEICFMRSMTLPAGVDAKKAKIDYRHGELRLTLPKSKACVLK